MLQASLPRAVDEVVHHLTTDPLPAALRDHAHAPDPSQAVTDPKQAGANDRIAVQGGDRPVQVQIVALDQRAKGWRGHDYGHKVIAVRSIEGCGKRVEVNIRDGAVLDFRHRWQFLWVRGTRCALILAPWSGKCNRGAILARQTGPGIVS